MEILDNRIEIEALKFLGVVEGVAHRIGRRGVGVQDADIEMLRPPIAVPVSLAAACEWALARAFVIRFCVHGFSPIACGNFCSALWIERTLEDFQHQVQSNCFHMSIR